jgi:hypothetical protein
MILKCTTCGGELAERADRCPHCSADIRPAVDPAKFSERAVQQGWITLMQALECHQMLSTPEGQGRSISDLLVSKGYLTPAQGDQICLELAPPSVPALPGYEPLKEIGKDRFGKIYRSLHQKTQVEVQVRLLKLTVPRAEFDAVMISIRKLTAIQHPSLVPILDVGCVGELLYLATQPVKGLSLAQALEGAPSFPEEGVRKIGRQLAEALQILLDQKVCQGELSPEMVMISADGAARICFPGLGYMLRQGAPGLLRTLSSPAYSAPEVHDGQIGSIRSDIYSLGLILYQCAAGSPPFAGSSLANLVARMKQGRPDPVPRLSSGFNQLVASMLHPDPAQRPSPPSRIVEAIDALGPVTAGAVPDVGKKKSQRAAPVARPAAPKTRVVPAAEGSKKTMIVTGAAIGGALVIAILLVVILGGKKSAPTPVAKRQPRVQEKEPETPPPPLPQSVDPATEFENLRGPAVDRHLTAGHFAQAMDGLAQLELRHPVLKSKIAALRDEVISRARQDLEKLCREIGRAWSAGARGEAEKLATDARPRFRDVAGMDRELEGYFHELQQVAGAGGAEQILATADRLISEAKELYDRATATRSVDLFTEAGFKAEQARIKYQAVQEVLEGDRQRHASQQLKVSIQLSKLISDGKKASGPARDPGPAAPAPVETARPKDSEPARPALPEDEAAVERCVEALNQFVSGASTFKPMEAKLSLLARVGARGERDERIAAAAWIFARIEQEPAAEGERKAVQEFLAKVDWRRFGGMTETEHAQALSWLEESRAKHSPGPLILTLEFAHLSRWMRLNPSSPEILKRGERLGLTAVEDPAGLTLATVSGAAVLKKEFASASNEPAVGFVQAFQRLQAFAELPIEEKRKDFAELTKLFRDLKPPAAQRSFCKLIADAFKSSAPCKRCTGEGLIDCASCVDGQAEFVCSACGALGGFGRIECYSCRGTGNNGQCTYCRGRGCTFGTPCRGCDQRGKWKDTCTKCKGAGKVDCVQCKAPWAEPKLDALFKLSSCPTCLQTGFGFDRILLLCPDCCGLGKIPTPKKP